MPTQTINNPDQSQPDQIIGAPVDRIDGPDKVTGKAIYAADVSVKQPAYAVLFSSSISNGKVTSINTTEARRHPGVLDIITHQNAPVLHRVSMNHKLGMPGQTQLPMQDDQVAYAGQYLGMVIAESFTAARDAALVISIQYDEQPAVLEMQKGMSAGFEPAKMGRGDKAKHNRGDADGALASAAVKVDQTYTTSILNHNPMEMSATTAWWDGDKLTLQTATQYVTGVRSIVSTWLGIPAENVRVIDPFVGGGFGCKGSSWPHEVLAAIAARAVNRPVKLVLSRAQMFTGVGYRPSTIQRVALGADKDGKLGSIIHECTSPTSTSKDEWVEMATKQSRMLYACDNVRTTQKLVPLNFNTPTQMRAPGHATGTFALEVAMDELAQALGIDPIELRLRNYAEKDGEFDLPFSSKALRECYAQGAARFGWDKRNAKPGMTRDGGMLVGYGMATATYPTNQEESAASVQINADGSAAVKTAAHDLGTGAYTILAQIASDTLGIDVNRISVTLADTELPPAPVAGGSQTSASVGSAVKVAAMKAAAELKERASADEKSPLAKTQPKQISLHGGRVFKSDDPSRGESIADLLARNGSRPIVAKGTATPPPAPGIEPDPQGSMENIERYSKHAWGAQFAEVRIDPDLKMIRVSRVVAAIAAGKILNAKTARSQIIGGITFGIGMSLLEQAVHDPVRGQVVNDDLADYLVPVNPDIGQIDCIFVDEPDKFVNPLGVKGIGEIGVTGACAAIANAIYNATGKRVRQLPVTLDQLLA